MTRRAEPVHIAGQLDLDGQPVEPAQVIAPNPTEVWVDVEITVRVPAADCWPGGEPARWDVETLADELRARYAGDLPGFLDDWGLTGSADVRLTAGARTADLRELT